MNEENNIEQSQNVKDISQIISIMRQDCGLYDSRFKDYKKESMLTLLNKKIKIQHWIQKDSKYGNKKALKIYCIDIATNKKFYFYTGSEIIKSQIQQILKKLNKIQSFLCIVKKVDKYYKLFSTLQNNE